MPYVLKVTLCYIHRLTWVNGIFHLFQFQRTKLLNGPDVETGTSTAIPQKKWLHFISPIFVQALTLTFLAEWGDRSQLTTIVLAAREVSVLDHVYIKTRVSVAPFQGSVRGHRTHLFIL
jgi:putative Ca2+/H+ antiporter (TMEM165/GDT1 family)